MDLTARRARYSKISTALAHLDDDALRGMLGKQATLSSWGTTLVVEVAGERVFVKLLPLSDLERGQAYSTRNHYRLPTFYQYGVGSAGFGAWRELVAHVKTTNWVLEGAIATFPIAYHVRVVERPGRTDLPSQERLDEDVRQWNSSRAIARFLTERAAGSHAAVVFLEHLPHTMGDWLADHPEDIDRMLSQLWDTVSFLRGQGISHFDAHIGNVVTDGELAYLTDFGLALDSRFDLTAREREFLDRHPHYDRGVVLCSPWPLLERWYHSLGEADRESVCALLGASDDWAELSRLLVMDVERLAGVVHPALAAATVRYRDVIWFMYDFFTRLQANRRKNTPFDDARLGDLLQTAGVLPG